LPLLLDLEEGGSLFLLFAFVAAVAIMLSMMCERSIEEDKAHPSEK